MQTEATSATPLGGGYGATLSVLAATLLALLIGIVSGWTVLFLGLGILILVLVVSRLSPWGEVALLILAIHLNIFNVEVGYDFINLRPGMVVAAALFVKFLFRVLSGRERWKSLPGVSTVLALAAAFWLSTLLNRDNPFYSRGVVSCTLLVLDVAIYLFFLHRLLSNAGFFDRAARWLIGINAVYAAAGIVLLLIHLTGFDPSDRLVDVNTLGNYVLEGSQSLIPRPWSFNPITGTYMAAVCVLALVKALQPGEPQRWRLVMSAQIIFVAVLMTISRGAWIGLTAGLAAFLITRVVGPLKRLKVRRLARNLAVAACLALTAYWVLAAVFPFVGDVIPRRLESLTALDQGTANDRLTFWGILVSDGLRSPVLGHGSDAYRVFTPFRTPVESFVVEAFHSTGLAGLGIYLWLNLLLIMKALRANIPALTAWALPFLASYAGLLVATQTNPGVWGNFYWEFLAFVAAAMVMRRGSPRRLESVELHVG